MRVAAIVLLASLAAAQESVALSCLQPDIVRSFKAAASSEDVYSVVRGRIIVEPASAAPRDASSWDMSQNARFEGWVLTPDGFVPADPQVVRLRMSCDGDGGMTCGPVTFDREVVAFLRHTGDSLVLEIGPCPQWLFPDPSPEVSRRLTECMTGGICVPEN